MKPLSHKIIVHTTNYTTIGKKSLTSQESNQILGSGGPRNTKCTRSPNAPIPLPDIRGAQGRVLYLLVQFFSFLCSFQEKLAKLKVGVPIWGLGNPGAVTNPVLPNLRGRTSFSTLWICDSLVSYKNSMLVSKAS